MATGAPAKANKPMATRETEEAAMSLYLTFELMSVRGAKTTC